MQFKFTFEDGTSGYLAHYGVKGMKWGVWNAETRARKTSTEVNNRIERREQAYNRAERRYSDHGWKGPIRKRVTRLLRDKALDDYAKAVTKAYDPKTAKEREDRRAIEEAAADKHLGDALSIGGETSRKGIDEYYRHISQLETGRAIDKAIPKGRDEVKKVLQWGHETSSKTDASIGGVPIKTEAEAKKYRELNARYEKTHENQYWNPSPKHKKAHEKTLSDFQKFEDEQRRKYLHA